ncbi:XTP/dITP diphosphatase [Oxyplasma meridianum]|uniref:XTP/dITP diphosphatase n=1 Tax=Oxyplasma meridianum TaxID=3073602 RepID=A0AAX4NH15_9ARCH
MIKFVTSNRNKFQEVKEMMEANKIDIDWIELQYEEIQADSTGEISRDSCTKIARKVDGKFFLEDTGLFIDPLNGFPGPYSSYVQKTIGNKGILRLLHNNGRDATFLTVVSYWDGAGIIQFSGELRGKISYTERGSNGFGYDPIFIPEGYEKSLAEMTIPEKNAISHRSIAVQKFIDHLKKENR